MRLENEMYNLILEVEEVSQTQINISEQESETDEEQELEEA